MSDNGSAAPENARTIRVWSAFVRVFHWGLVICFFVAYFAGDDYETLHLIAGYAAAALITARVVAGFTGAGYTRFAQFMRAPHVVLSYLADIIKGREVRYIGHNPAGAAMISALLLTLIGICVTGWLLTDLYWGSAVLERAHEWLTNLALALIAVHVGGVILASLRHRENLVAAMFTGRKRAADRDTVGD